jgi:hypothetical protein
MIGESLREALTGLSTNETAILTKALQRVIANLHSDTACEQDNQMP